MKHGGASFTAVLTITKSPEPAVDKATELPSQSVLSTGNFGAQGSCVLTPVTPKTECESIRLRSPRPDSPSRDSQNRHPVPCRSVAVELSKATALRILDLEAPKRTGGNPNVKLTIGIVSMLAAFPLFFPFITRYLAIMLFLCGSIVYCSGLIENTSYARARKQAAAPRVTCRNCNSLTTATSQRCNYCGARLQED